MSRNKDGAAAVGVATAACAVCCAGPILGFLAALGVAGAISVAALGLVGGVLVATIGLIVYRRRRGTTACAAEPETVTVAGPTSPRSAATAGVGASTPTSDRD